MTNADLVLDLALVLGAARQAGIDVEAQATGVAAVGRVDLAPGPGPLADAGLEVVDAHHRRDAAEAAEGLVVGVVPGQLVHALGTRSATSLRRVGQDHDEGIQRLRPVADVDVGKLAPIDLGLGARRRLDAPEGPQPGLG